MKFDAFKKGTDYDLLIASGKPTNGRFQRAFQKYKSFPKDQRVAVDRTWCREVLEAFARQIHVPFSLAVQSFKTGNMEALREYHMREMKAYLATLKEGQTVDDTQVNYHFATMQENKFFDEVRKAFSFGLGLRHPNDGYRRDDENENTKNSGKTSLDKKAA